MKHSIYTQQSKSPMHLLFNQKFPSFPESFRNQNDYLRNTMSVMEAENMIDELEKRFHFVFSQDWMSTRIHDKLMKEKVYLELRSNYNYALMMWNRCRLYDKRWKIEELNRIISSSQYLSDDTIGFNFDNEDFVNRDTFEIVRLAAKLIRLTKIVSSFHHIVIK